MSVSTDGQICYGIKFDEDFEFPWDSEEWEADIEKWWIYGVCGYKNPFELYDSDGEYIDGEKPSPGNSDEYYCKKREFHQQHPMPVELVNYCSGDYPIYILSVPGSMMSASRGYPKDLTREDFSVDEREVKNLIDFCHKYLSCEDERSNFVPKWWLSGFWG